MPPYAYPADSGFRHFLQRKMRALGSQAQECLESGHGCLSAVETKDKFIEIILQVFCIDTVMSAVEPGLQITEYPMNGQGVGFGMVELVTIPSHCACGIPFPLIGINLGSQLHIIRQEATNGNFIRPFGFSQPESTGSLHVIAMLIGVDEDFHGSKNQRTMLRATPLPLLPGTGPPMRTSSASTRPRRRLRLASTIPRRKR